MICGSYLNDLLIRLLSLLYGAGTGAGADSSVDGSVMDLDPEQIRFVAALLLAEVEQPLFSFVKFVRPPRRHVFGLCVPSFLPSSCSVRPTDRPTDTHCSRLNFASIPN